MAQTSHRLREELENRIRFETLISDISARFVKLSAEDMDCRIEEALTQIREFFGVDRCGFLSVSPGKPFACITHASYADGIEHVSKEIDMAGLFPWTYQQLVEKGQCVAFTRMDELPPEAGKDCQGWSAMGVKSRLAIPLFNGREIRYILAIQSVVKERDWPREFVPRLKLIGEIFVNALERRDTYKALRESESRLNLAANAADAGLWTLDVASGIFWVTEKTRDLFAFPQNTDITFDDFLAVVHPDDRPMIQQAVDQAIQSKEEIKVQYRILRSDGSIRWMSSRGHIQFQGSENPGLLMGVTIDITERKGTEERLLASQKALRAFTSRLLTIQEEERRRLARELHDDLSQRLAVLAIETGQLEKKADPGSKLQHIREQLVKLSADVHDISRQLHPSIIDDLGLVDAMNSECLSFSRRENLEIRFEQSHIPPRIPRDVAICFYRVLQESLRNVKKHAVTDRAEVAIFGDGEELVLRIRDAGVGFDIEKAHHKAGLGLVSMEERARLIKGEFKIQSRPGEGTTIELRALLGEE